MSCEHGIENLNDIRLEEIGGIEIIEIAADFCDGFGERWVRLWVQSSIWADELQQVWQWRVDNLERQLFGWRMKDPR